MRIIPLPTEAEALLPQLGVEAADVTRVEAMAGGLSGGRIYRLWLRHPDGVHEQTRVLKYAESLEGWLGDVSGDTLIREAQLAASGLLADLPRTIATPTLAVACCGPPEQPEGAALLMRDEQRHLLRDPYWTPPGRIPSVAVAMVDRLARMHARYWNDPRLDDPALGLMSPERSLLVTGPLGVAARLAAGDTLPYLSVSAEGWQTFFELAGVAATERFQAIMNEPESDHACNQQVATDAGTRRRMGTKSWLANNKPRHATASATRLGARAGWPRNLRSTLARQYVARC